MSKDNIDENEPLNGDSSEESTTDEGNDADVKDEGSPPLPTSAITTIAISTAVIAASAAASAIKYISG